MKTNSSAPHQSTSSRCGALFTRTVVRTRSLRRTLKFISCRLAVRWQAVQGSSAIFTHNVSTSGSCLLPWLNKLPRSDRPSDQGPCATHWMCLYHIWQDPISGRRTQSISRLQTCRGNELPYSLMPGITSREVFPRFPHQYTFAATPPFSPCGVAKYMSHSNLNRNPLTGSLAKVRLRAGYLTRLEILHEEEKCMLEDVGKPLQIRIQIIVVLYSQPIRTLPRTKRREKHYQSLRLSEPAHIIWNNAFSVYTKVCRVRRHRSAATGTADHELWTLAPCRHAAQRSLRSHESRTVCNNSAHALIFRTKSPRTKSQRRASIVPSASRGGGEQPFLVAPPRTVLCITTFPRLSIAKPWSCLIG